METGGDGKAYPTAVIGDTERSVVWGEYSEVPASEVTTKGECPRGDGQFDSVFSPATSARAEKVRENQWRNK